MLNLAAIVGPTAVGKTATAIKVARQIRGEIISCDSMQVYRGMDIGTAKANAMERAAVPHHLLDIVDISEDYNVARYQAQVRQIVIEVNERRHLPILVGGTGLYYQSVVDDYQFYPIQSKQAIRQKWHNMIEATGLPEVYKLLQAVDPEYAVKISANDEKRIIRALEVYELTGIPFSRHQLRKKDSYNTAAVGLDMDRAQLYRRIEERVEQMMEMGLVREVMNLMESGVDSGTNAMQALGYKQVVWFLRGLISEKEMITEIKRETRRFAKRQLTWFRRDPRIHWITVQNNDKDDVVVEKILTRLEGQFPGA